MTHSVVLDLNRSLALWLRFNSNGDLRDYSSYGNNGTNHGASWTGIGRYGGAYNFNGFNKFLYDINLSLKFNISNSFSFINSGDNFPSGV